MGDGTSALARPDGMDTGATFEREVMRHLDAAYNLARWLARNDADAEDVVQEAVLRAADAQSLHAALERLPPEFREVLVLRELEECSYKEIASITNLKIGTVMSRLARARERLQRELTGKEVDA
jgi:DNA-directed RNA polymerase specialized sigma24 family protein